MYRMRNIIHGATDHGRQRVAIKDKRNQYLRRRVMTPIALPCQRERYDIRPPPKKKDRSVLQTDFWCGLLLQSERLEGIEYTSLAESDHTNKSCKRQTHYVTLQITMMHRSSFENLSYLADEERRGRHDLTVTSGSGLTGSGRRGGDCGGRVVGDVCSRPLLALTQR